MEARGKRAAFSEVRWARSVRPRRRQLPQGPSVCDKIAASSDCSRPVNDYVHIEAADLCRPNARFTQERQGYQVLTPFEKLGYSQKYWVYPGFPTPFWGLSGFFVGDLIGKALWELVENAQRFPRHGGRVLCVHGAVSFHRARPCATRWLPGRGPMRDVELDRCVLGLQSTGEQLCSRQHRRPVHAERSIYPGKTGISGAYAIWETRI